MFKAVVFSFVAFLPAQSDDTPILITPDERRAIVEKFWLMQDLLERQEKALRTCRSIQSS